MSETLFAAHLQALEPRSNHVRIAREKPTKSVHCMALPLLLPNRATGAVRAHFPFTLRNKGRFKLRLYKPQRTGKFKGINMITRFLRDETGATSVEYGIIASILSLAIITGVGALAVQLNQMWGDNNGSIGNALN